MKNIITIAFAIISITAFAQKEGGQLMFTGHSLGGGLASANALSTGCNAITLHYNASSDKKINFENRSIQSSNVCKDDFDSFYVNALNSIRKYE